MVLTQRIGRRAAMHTPLPRRSGRIEARIGLRMMPTFPRSSLSFRTAGFPQYGWKAGFSNGAFPDRPPLKPAPGIRRPNIWFASALRAPRSHNGCPALCRAEDSIAHRRGGSLLLRPRGPRSGPGYSVPVRHHLSAPSVPLVGTSRFHRMATYTRCLRCAGAPRRPASGSELSLLIPSWHAALSDPGESDIDIFQNFDADIGLRRMTTGSALPTLPQSVPRGQSISWLHWFASATACQVACPPVRIRLGRPAIGDFYFQAFNGSVTLPVAGYNYNSDWTLLLAGLSPAGMAASFAARSFTTEPSRSKRNL